MGGVGAAAQGGGIGLQLGGRAMAVQVQPRTLQLGVGRTLELLQGHRDLIGVAQKPVAIPIGQVHGLHQPVDRGGTIGARGLQVEGSSTLSSCSKVMPPPLGGGMVSTW
jgi:hypothetical protein